MPSISQPPDAVLLAALLVALLGLTGCASTSGALPGAAPLESVEDLDLDRYLGRWYEIERYPNSFQKRLVGVTADYDRRPDGRIQVVNRGYVDTLDGGQKTARAKAWIPDVDQPARLRVQFFWPFTGNYWVIALDPDYQWAVVGEPKRRYLWILSRTPEMDPARLESIRSRITELGYDVERLVPTPQVANEH